MIQAVIDADIVKCLIDTLENAEYEIKKEAAWAISNATSGGNRNQIVFLTQEGCIPPLCDLLTCIDARIILVALEGLQNILKVGSYMQVLYLYRTRSYDWRRDLAVGRFFIAWKCHLYFQEYHHTKSNSFADTIEASGGLDKLESLQEHNNREIYEKAFQIIDSFFETEEDIMDGQNIRPDYNDDGTYSFNPNMQPNGGFNFS